VAESYKQTIENEFFPVRGLGKARLSVARKAVNDYKRFKGYAMAADQSEMITIILWIDQAKGYAV